MGRSQLALAAALACGLGALTAAPAGAAFDAAAMYRPTTVVAIDLQLPPDSVAALEADPDEYVVGTFALHETDGSPGGIAPAPVQPPLTVGVRLKGGLGSFRDLTGKAAFKVKFNEFVSGQKFLGLKKMTLNNMVQDPSMLHEVLAYEAFEAAGVAAPRTGYAYVHLNGVDYGLHLNLETLDDVALKRLFGDFDDPQHLYEGGPWVDVVPADLDEFEIDEGEEEDISDLEALAAAAVADAPSFSERLAPVADLDQMTAFWAAERYLGHWDGYSGPNVNNYYLLSDPGGVFQMLPWGTDQTLHHSYPFAGPGGILFEQCLAEEACLVSYRAKLEAVADSTSAIGPAQRATELTALLAPWQARELAESQRAPHSAAEIADAVAAVHEFLDRRPGLLVKWLSDGEDPDPADPGPGAEDPVGRGPSTPSGPSAPTPSLPALSTRLELDRSQLGAGLLLGRLTLRSAGALSTLAIAGPAGQRRRACTIPSRQLAAGSHPLRCQLSTAVRQRLAGGPLTLTLRLQLRPDDGSTPTLLERRVRLPATADRSH